MSNYLPRIIDSYLADWAQSVSHKPVLLRGARQVGKSWAVRKLGESFKFFIEINFEKNPEFKSIFETNLDIERILEQISILTNIQISDGETLIFFDEIQFCEKAIMALRFFKEDRPGLHVIAAGSLLEMTLEEMPTFGVGRIHSMFMYPMTFDEFLTANNQTRLLQARNEATSDNPLPEPMHQKLKELFRSYLIVGGMPEVVSNWVKTRDYVQCQQLLDDILLSYEDDFAKYRKKAEPELLKRVFRSAAVQLNKKFTYSAVPGNYKTYEVKKALGLLIRAGLLTPVVRTHANGIPLGSEIEEGYVKILTLDPGLTLRLLHLTTGDITHLVKNIMTSSDADLVNKGPMAELVAGLEILHYQSLNLKHELYYWARSEKNSVAEVDYVISPLGRVLPVQVKSGVQGGMKSLWLFMRLKNLDKAVRVSFENFGWFQYLDSMDSDAERDVVICPLYAISQLNRLIGG